MPIAAMTGVDQAGGVIGPSGGTGFYINGQVIAVVGDPVSGHGKDAHGSPVMASGASNFNVNGIAVCRSGDPATCGHTSSGSSTFSVA